MIAPLERHHHPGPPSDLLHDPLQRVVGSDFVPLDVRKGVVGQGLANVRLDQLGRLSIGPQLRPWIGVEY